MLEDPWDEVIFFFLLLSETHEGTRVSFQSVTRWVFVGNGALYVLLLEVLLVLHVPWSY